MTISVPPHHRRVAPRSTHVLAKMMVPAMAVGAPSGVPFHELPKSHEFTPLTPFHLRERAIHKLDQLMDLSEIVASRPLRHNWHQSNVAQDAKVGTRPHGLQVLAKIVVPAIAVGAPAGSTGGHTTLANGDRAISPTAMTPQEGAHIANILCDPRALETAMHHIKNLSSNFRSVRSSFDKVVMSIETLNLLNPLDRYHVRHATRQLEVVRALSERFEGMVQQSRVEARQAASVVTRYRDTVLDAVHERQSIEALKGEIQQIAQAIADHERNAERLERDFHDVSQSIHAVSAIILESVKRNQARIDFEALTTLCDNTMELDKNMAQCDESSLAFLHALLGIGQHCAGLAVAAFGPDTALFDDDTTAAYRQYFADKLWEYLPRLSHKKTMSDLRGTKRNNSGVTDPKKASLTQNLASLDDSAAKVSDMAGLWSALNMDLHKISSWLSLKLEGGEVQGSWELLGESVNIMRGSTADLIRHLHDYSTSNL